jgi:hypothetical protein
MSIKLRQHFEKIIPLTDQEFEYILSHFATKKLKKHQFLGNYTHLHVEYYTNVIQ